jgi:hypothetical protein
MQTPDEAMEETPAGRLSPFPALPRVDTKVFDPRAIHTYTVLFTQSSAFVAAVTYLRDFIHIRGRSHVSALRDFIHIRAASHSRTSLDGKVVDDPCRVLLGFRI